MIFYALVDLDTGEYLPQPGIGRGYTHTEPVSPGSAHPPRMFADERAAQCALTWWLKGEVERDSWTEDDWLGNQVTVRGGVGQIHPEPGRARRRMVVVPVEVTLRTGLARVPASPAADREINRTVARRRAMR